MKIYLACPLDPMHREAEVHIVNMLRERGFDVYFPAEFKIPNAWDYPNNIWGKMVFEHDIEELKTSDIVVMLSMGRQSSAGCNWEAGYAYGIGKRVIVVEMVSGVDMSLMVSNGCYAVLEGQRSLHDYDFEEKTITDTYQT